VFLQKACTEGDLDAVFTILVRRKVRASVVAADSFFGVSS
jgi:hypothetical protein